MKVRLGDLEDIIDICRGISKVNVILSWSKLVPLEANADGMLIVSVVKVPEAVAVLFAVANGASIVARGKLQVPVALCPEDAVAFKVLRFILGIEPVPVALPVAFPFTKSKVTVVIDAVAVLSTIAEALGAVITSVAKEQDAVALPADDAVALGGTTDNVVSELVAIASPLADANGVITDSTDKALVAVALPFAVLTGAVIDRTVSEQVAVPFTEPDVTSLKAIPGNWAFLVPLLVIA